MSGYDCDGCEWLWWAVGGFGGLWVPLKECLCLFLLICHTRDIYVTLMTLKTLTSTVTENGAYLYNSPQNDVCKIHPSENVDFPKVKYC